MNYKFSNRTGNLKPSEIREILKATGRGDIIPFAAGNPDEKAFPICEVQKLTKKILEETPVSALQYGVSEGFEPLRNLIFKKLSEKNCASNNDEVLITSGATQIMELLTKTLCNEGDTVICENPSFIGSLNCFRSMGCKLEGIPLENDGINLEILEKTLQSTENAKFIYTIPNFQNPSGCTLSLKKRHKLYELAKKYGVIILEDNPYGNLRVKGDEVPPIKSFDQDGLVVYAGSFSKILSPGIRVGYVCAPKEIISKMTVFKQAEDVHTPMLCQLLVYRWLTETDYKSHIEKNKSLYRKKLELMCDLTEQKISDYLDFIRPDGGMFVWCKLKNNIDMQDFVKKALENGVAVVPGTAFLTDKTEHTNSFRMNFTTPSDEQIKKGIDILEKVLKELNR